MVITRKKLIYVSGCRIKKVQFPSQALLKAGIYWLVNLFLQTCSTSLIRSFWKNLLWKILEN